MVDQNAYIGKQYGIYIIKSILDKKDKYGHFIYNGVCQECGFIKTGTIYDFKNKNTQICTHWSKLTQEQRDIWYNKNKRQCLYCGKNIPLNTNSPSEYKRRKFCNNSCAASYNNKCKEKKHKYCLNCGEEMSLRNQMYCSLKCQQEYQYKEYIERWKNGEENGLSGQYGISKILKKYLFKKYNNKCSKCGWGEINQFTGNIPLEIHHKDGNYLNNTEDNLELLCPNCHSLTNTYKGSNRGNGREARKKYN